MIPGFLVVKKIPGGANVTVNNVPCRKNVQFFQVFVMLAKF